MEEKTEYYKNELNSANKITSKNIFKVLMAILLPIFLYNLLNYAYEIYDTLVISASGIGGADSIFVLNQIKKGVATLGAGFITGALVLVAQKIGSKEMEKANSFLNTVFYLTLIFSLIVLFLLIPMSSGLLAILQTPEQIISSSTGYFSVQLGIIVLEWFNLLFIGIQKIKGKASIVFYLNIGVIALKIGITTLLAFGGFAWVSTIHLALVTLLAQSFMFVFALIHLFNKKSILCVSKKFFMDKSILKTIVKIGFPIFLGQFIFNFSKVYFNSQISIFYGTAILSAFAISNIFVGINQQFLTASLSASSVIISQNYGKEDKTRMIEAHNTSLYINLAVTLISFLIITFFSKSLIMAVSSEHIEMTNTILNIQKYEMFFTAATTSATALTRAVGKTKIEMFSNILRTLLLRIPLIFLFFYTFGLGFTSTMHAQVISNILGAFFSAGLSIYVIKTIFKNKNKQNEKVVLQKK